jgi:hypothetical protein
MKIKIMKHKMHFIFIRYFLLFFTIFFNQIKFRLNIWINDFIIFI